MTATERFRISCGLAALSFIRSLPRRRLFGTEFTRRFGATDFAPGFRIWRLACHGITI